MKGNLRTRYELISDLEAVRRWLYLLTDDATRFHIVSIQAAINEITQAICDLQRDGPARKNSPTD